MTKQRFEQILIENKDKIYRICRIYATAPIDAQDLFQDVVFEIWKSLPTFQGKSSIHTWVYRIALKVCYRSKLQLSKSNKQTIRLDAIQFEPAVSSRDVLSEQRYDALRSCISALDESQQSLVVLYLEELPYKQIAEIMGVTENHVAVKMKRIRALLFNCITDKLK